MKKYFLLAAIVLGAFMQTHAQSYTASHNTSILVNKNTSITVTSTNSVNIANTIDYTVGTVLTNFWSVQVNCNASWQVTVNASAANFSPTTTNTVPVSIMSFRKNGTTQWKTMTNAAQVVNTGSIGSSATAGNTFGVDLQVIPTLAYEPGTYTVNIVFTSTAQ